MPTFKNMDKTMKKLVLQLAIELQGGKCHECGGELFGEFLRRIRFSRKPTMDDYAAVCDFCRIG